MDASFKTTFLGIITLGPEVVDFPVVLNGLTAAAGVEEGGCTVGVHAAVSLPAVAGLRLGDGLAVIVVASALSGMVSDCVLSCLAGLVVFIPGRLVVASVRCTSVSLPVAVLAGAAVAAGCAVVVVVLCVSVLG